MSWIAGRSGTPLLTAYCASKVGIVGLTRTAAMELAPFGIQANSVSPAAKLTGMSDYQTTPEMVEMMNGLQPRGVAGTPEEVASAIQYLSSDEAANMIGHDMVVDGALPSTEALVRRYPSAGSRTVTNYDRYLEHLSSSETTPCSGLNRAGRRQA